MMWIYLLQGIGFGLAAASQPGLLQTYLISQALTNGWRRTLTATLAPLVSDEPIIVVCLLVLNQVPAWMEKALYGVRGLFVLYLAFGAYQSWRSGSATIQGVGDTRQIGLTPLAHLFYTLAQF
jgi:threonine/homoserine/homoserine lactone efflux protein